MHFLFYRELDSAKEQLQKSEGDVSRILWSSSQQIYYGLVSIIELSYQKFHVNVIIIIIWFLYFFFKVLRVYTL